MLLQSRKQNTTSVENWKADCSTGHISERFEEGSLVLVVKFC